MRDGKRTPRHDDAVPQQGLVDELQDEMEEQGDELEAGCSQEDVPIDPEKLKAELTEMRGFVEMARRISVNAKGVPTRTDCASWEPCWPRLPRNVRSSFSPASPTGTAMSGRPPLSQ